MKRSPKGGTVGANGEFYEGGKFLPSTTLPKRHEVKRPTGPRREMIAPFEWADRPEGMRSLYAILVGNYAEMVGQVMATFETGIRNYGETVRFLGNDLGSVYDLIDRYNAGERWIAA